MGKVELWDLQLSGLFVSCDSLTDCMDINNRDMYLMVNL